MRTFKCALTLLAAVAASSCGKDSSSDGGGDDGGSTTGGSGITVTTSATTLDTSASASAETTGSASLTSASETTAADATATGSGTAGTTGGGGAACGGTIWACGDGMDNDDDGLIDLMDPECTGPCDDDEGSFQTGLPGDNMDCKQDCFFDGNSGQGDDGCIWDLRCDPNNPGANIGCEYTGGNNCDQEPPNQSEGCIMFCEQFVPPGCDCFGCCTVDTPDGPVSIFLGGGDDCSLDNLDACTMCMSQIDQCGTPCNPEDCEICFGETMPPEGCGENTCTSDLPCMADSDCPTDYFCYLSCCYPPPPG